MFHQETATHTARRNRESPVKLMCISCRRNLQKTHAGVRRKAETSAGENGLNVPDRSIWRKPSILVFNSFNQRCLQTIGRNTQTVRHIPGRFELLVRRLCFFFPGSFDLPALIQGGDSLAKHHLRESRSQRSFIYLFKICTSEERMGRLSCVNILPTSFVFIVLRFKLILLCQT